jgi:hypothetical protein
VGVRAWEIGNEPNLRHFWSGTPDDYARFLEVAYEVIKWRDPAAEVVHGGIAGDASAPAWYGSFLEALKRRRAATGRGDEAPWFFDAAAWHWYAYPDLLFTGPEDARRLLAAAGVPERPIWITEFGVPVWSEYPGPCWDPLSPWRATTAEQSAYLWQSVVEAAAGGVRRLFLFQLYDDCGNGPASYDAFGVVRNQRANQCWVPPEEACWSHDPGEDGTPRPALAAIAAAADVLGPALPLWHPGASDGWERVLLYLPPDRRVTAVWNRNRAAKTVSIGATGPEATVFRLDEAGLPVEEAMAPTAGAYSVELPGATNRNNPPGHGPLMAGRPVLLVERDTVAPFRAELTGPSSASGEVALTVRAADGGTGVAAFQLLGSTTPPSDPSAWTRVGEPIAWTAEPVAGEMSTRYRGEPGSTVFLAVRVMDRAGNWTSAPAVAQVVVGFEGAAASPTPFTAVVHLALPLALDGARLPGHEGPPPTPTRAPSTSTAPPPSPSRPPTAAATATAAATEALPTTVPASPTPVCTPVAVPVADARDLPLTAGAGTWTLRAFAPGRDVVESTQAIGSAACVAFAPERLTAVADAPGYVAWPPQDLAERPSINLAAAPNVIVNGSFEAGLDGWSALGAPVPAAAAPGLSGAQAALLAPNPDSAASLSQAVEVPAGGATLSMELDLIPCRAQGCLSLGGLDITVTDLEAGTSVGLTPPGGLRTGTEGWDHLWYDLGPWAGRRVAVTIRLARPAGADETQALLDNVAVGGIGPGKDTS